MSPSKTSRDIKVKVPRHNSQRIGPALTGQVESLAREQNVRVDVRQTAYEPQNILAQAIESASDWNSLLMTARAERGPQWDIGTQQFMVDDRSDLYYDPSPLMEYLKDGKTEGEENAEQSSMDRPSQPPADGPGTPQTRRSHGLPPTNPNQINFSPRQPGGQFPPGQGMPGPFSGGMAPIPASQFYGNGAGGDQHMSSPMRMGGMGLPGDGGMGGMGMGSPEVGRRMTRGMGMGGDGFGGMH
ncbi:hypothetical protein EIP91_007925 [Steccherinum ochraceum]|uniref:Uncharacterized protein n=1 Tax=Steccherinum ochraceum TaxID=92696 RepID=A0A4R0RUF3_9APHY|nr:hypothetical protein EIP91_007925 [Steccherinum ochraceum]